MEKKTESGDYLDRLEAHWEVMVMIQATAITAASRAAIQSVIDAFTEDIDAELQRQRTGIADREETEIRRKLWD